MSNRSGVSPKKSKSKRSRKKRLDLSSDAVSEEMQGRFGGGVFGAQLSELRDSGSFDVDHLPNTSTHEETAISQSDKSESEQMTPISALGPKRQLKLAITRAGRGGKTVTTLKVSATASAEARALLVKTLGRQLGCRAWLEDDLLITQGDQRERIKKWVSDQR